MARPKKICIVHKESKLHSCVLPSTLAAWERNGWTAVDDGDDAVVFADDDTATDPDEPGDNKE